MIDVIYMHSYRLNKNDVSKLRKHLNETGWTAFKIKPMHINYTSVEEVIDELMKFKFGANWRNPDADLSAPFFIAGDIPLQVYAGMLTHKSTFDMLPVGLKVCAVESIRDSRGKVISHYTSNFTFYP